MKLLYIFVLLFCSGSVFSQLDPSNELTDMLLARLGVKKFYKDLVLVKDYPSVTYASEINHSVQKFRKYWEYWKDFRLRRYQKELEELVILNFSIDELIILKNHSNRGIYARVIKALSVKDDYITLYVQLLTGQVRSLAVSDKRFTIISKLYKYFGQNIIEQNLVFRMMNLSRMEDIITKITHPITKNEIFLRSENFEYNARNAKRLLYYLLAMNLRRFSDHELEVFLKKASNSTIRRFSQLYLNFHYLFLTDFILENEVKKGLIQSSQ